MFFILETVRFSVPILQEMSKPGALDLANSVGGTIAKEEVNNAVERYVLSPSLSLSPFCLNRLTKVVCGMVQV